MEQQQLTNPVSFNGRGGEFFGIWIVNILLSIITLGIYSAWAKVRTKRYFYGNTHIDGDNFEYHAQPIQILKGRLVALAVVLAWSISSNFFPVASMALLLVFYAALPWLLWSNARFDAAMTSYRNVHFSFTAPLKQAYVTLLGRGVGALLIIMTYIGIIIAVSSVSVVTAVLMGAGAFVLMSVIYAWVIAGAHQFFTNGYQYGDWKFSADLKLGFFVKLYLKALMMGVVAALVFLLIMFFGLMGSLDMTQVLNGDFSSLSENLTGAWLMFAAYGVMIVLSITLTAYTTTSIRNYIFSQLAAKHEEQADVEYQFVSKLTVSSYVWLVLSNFLLQVVTLGIARPWVMVRTSRYLADRTAVIGDMSYLVARDEASDVKSAVSDEVAQAFDLGIGIS
ncbi:YjgN family protein [Vibrio atypicus]|uniref:YjgN family protein n=1 Tax=Vibrio atypicus TaxID=558271 RepID=UPI00135ABB90|nr:YjgN family protein [Vibrio atypicus]